MHTLTKTLDVSVLPTVQAYISPGGNGLDVVAFLEEQVRPVISLLMTNGQIRDVDSFGFAMAMPLHRSMVTDMPAVLSFGGWDDPEELTWLTWGWGPNRDRYVANAVRKMRYSARTLDDSIVTQEDPGSIDTPVDSAAEDGSFPWGDFPWGGAAYVDVEEMAFLGASSALTQREDHHVTVLILSLLANAFHKLDHPDE